ncbi:MAG: DUF4291 domain-containing protein [Burkholderiales bacterium]|nr:DUF4291 domain-containing protein [Burkholderiales bacterium]
MKITTQKYTTQNSAWPQRGRHILACFDDSTIVVYQAYRPSIGQFAVEHGRFGGPDFSLSRMSWIKPNFHWMMYRCGWGLKEGQEIVLGLRISRQFFDSVLAEAVPSTFDAEAFSSRDAWQVAVAKSNVRLQWDPDHAPDGAKQERKAIQLGLRGEVLQRFASSELLEVIDMTAFVAAQRQNAIPAKYPQLEMPAESVYEPSLPSIRRNIRLDTF